jgi:nucleotide-binding universal stress UspA family protein
MLAIRTILHPTDFSECAAHAYRLAVALSRDYRARLHVVHVITQPDLALLGELLPAEPLRHQRALAAALREIGLSAPGVHVDYQIISDGNAADEIVRAAAEAKADLVVMGTHGRTGLKRVLMGSVAAAVLTRATCPVVTVRGHWFAAAGAGHSQARQPATVG